MSTTDDPGPGDGWQPPSTPPSSAPPPPPPPPPPGYAPPPPPNYGYAPPPAGATPKTEGTAVAALVCAIGSFVLCIPILAIVALPLVSSARSKIANSGGTLTGENLLGPAKIIAWINLGLWAVAIVGFIALLVLGAALDSSSTSDFDRVILPR